MPRPCANAEFDCDGVLGDNSENDYCAKCRSHDKRWAKRAPRDVRARLHNVTCWQHRISMHPAAREEKKKNGSSGAKVVQLNTTTTPQMRKRA